MKIHNALIALNTHKRIPHPFFRF